MRMRNGGYAWGASDEGQANTRGEEPQLRMVMGQRLCGSEGTAATRCVEPRLCDTRDRCRREQAAHGERPLSTCGEGNGAYAW